MCCFFDWQANVTGELHFTKLAKIADMVQAVHFTNTQGIVVQGMVCCAYTLGILNRLLQIEYLIFSSMFKR